MQLMQLDGKGVLKMNINEEMLYIGKCQYLLTQGFDREQISRLMDKPLDRVDKWIAMIARANAVRIKRDLNRG